VNFSKWLSPVFEQDRSGGDALRCAYVWRISGTLFFIAIVSVGKSTELST
jgi:hypothetical protein